jgi:hypothetical protein
VIVRATENACISYSSGRRARNYAVTSHYLHCLPFPILFLIGLLKVKSAAHTARLYPDMTNSSTGTIAVLLACIAVSDGLEGRLLQRHERRTTERRDLL